MNTVASKDGTRIAYARSGSGPPLIIIDGALCSRGFGPSPKLAPLLARHFTVVAYDRCGRGDSDDRSNHSRDREIEDLAAVIGAAGGHAHLVGLSSGGALALEAAAAGLSVAKVLAYEPPYVFDDGRDHTVHQGKLRSMISEGRRSDAVKYFLRDMVGVPAPFVLMLHLLPHIWPKLKAVAHTLPYDAAVMNDFAVPAQRLSKISGSTVIMHGGKSDERLKKAAEAVAAAVPGAVHRTLEGQNHNVNPKALAAAVHEHFAG